MLNVIEAPLNDSLTNGQVDPAGSVFFDGELSELAIAVNRLGPFMPAPLNMVLLILPIIGLLDKQPIEPNDNVNRKCKVYSQVDYLYNRNYLLICMTQDDSINA